MNKIELADQKHRAGYNCAQAVACVFAEEVRMDEAVLYKVCEGFGGGVGCMKGQCGALSGAIVLAGIVNSNADIENPGKTKGATYKLSGAILNAFVDKAGALICRDIKGIDTGKPITSCADCITIAVEVVQEVLGL